jgi:signal transduction histidine kinase
VIHELKNSLAILTLQSRLLSARDSLHAEQGESLTIIQDQVKRMAHMLDSLRRSADPLEPHLEATDVNGLVRHTLDLYRHQFEMDGIEVIASLETGLPAIQADPWKPSWTGRGPASCRFRPVPTRVPAAGQPASRSALSTTALASPRR